MNNLYFSSDYHLGHANILKYCFRKPFLSKREIEVLAKGTEAQKKRLRISKSSLQRMNDGIIKNHNARVQSNDTFFHIGDFCFRNSRGGKVGEGAIDKASTYLEKLNGNKIFIKGSHDHNNSLKTKLHRIILNIANIYIDLVHDPKDILLNSSEYYYPLHLVGHVHNTWHLKEFENHRGEVSLCINCGIDVNKFRPISFNEVMSFYYKWLNHHQKKADIIRNIKKTNNRKFSSHYKGRIK